MQWYNNSNVKFTKVMPVRINQENIYNFLTSTEFKNWFLGRFENGRTQQPYDQFMFNFSRFLELKGTDSKFHFRLENMLHSLQVCAGKIILTMNEGGQISGYALCPLDPPATIFKDAA